MNFPKLHELVAATHSPFHEDGSLAPEVVPMQAAFLHNQGIRTVFITGSTGESHSLTLNEKLRLYDAWAAAGPSAGLRVVAHVGGNCLEDCKILAASAQERKFLAISALAPSYFKPADVPAMVQWSESIAKAAPDTPFYHYDIPVLTGVHLSMPEYLRQARERIPTLAGIKFTNPDLVAYLRSLEVAGEALDLPWGVDETLLAALATGARGGVGSTYNWAPHIYHKLEAAFHAGDFTAARSWQSTSIKMIDAIAATGFLGTAKAIMARLGVPVGPARQPLANPSASQVDSVMAKLTVLGVFPLPQ